MVFGDDVHLSVLYCLDGSAIVANILLLFVIIRSTPKAMQSYSIFLLNDVIIDIASAMASGLTVARVMCLPDDRVIIVYVGQCDPIGGIIFCNICQCIQTMLAHHSHVMLLLAFIYRVQIVRNGNAFVKLPSRMKVCGWCLLSYIVLSPIWFSFYTSIIMPSETEREHLLDSIHLDNYPLSLLDLSTTRGIITVLFFGLFTPVIYSLMYFLRKSLIFKISTMVGQISGLTFQMLLPVVMALSFIAWTFDRLHIYPSHLSQRMIIVANSIIALASPIINLLYIPPYRKRLTISKISRENTSVVSHIR